MLGLARVSRGLGFGFQHLLAPIKPDYTVRSYLIQHTHTYNTVEPCYIKVLVTENNFVTSGFTLHPGYKTMKRLDQQNYNNRVVFIRPL